MVYFQGRDASFRGVYLYCCSIEYEEIGLNVRVFLFTKTRGSSENHWGEIFLRLLQWKKWFIPLFMTGVSYIPGGAVFFFPMNRWFLGPCLQYFLWGDDPIWQIFLDPVDATTPHYNSGQLVFEKNPFWFTLPRFPVRWCLRKMAQLHRSFPFRRTEEPRPALQIHRGLKVKP